MLAERAAREALTTFRMANVDHAARAAISKDELHTLMAEAAGSGEYDLPRREGSDHITPIDGVIATVMTRVEQPEDPAHGVLRIASQVFIPYQAISICRYQVP